MKKLKEIYWNICAGILIFLIPVGTLLFYAIFVAIAVWMPLYLIYWFIYYISKLF